MSRGFGGIVKQAQAMQQKMAKMQEEMEQIRIEASVGGGVVSAIVTGRQKLVSLKIDKSVVDPEDIDMLQDLVITAVNEAIKKSQDLQQGEVAKVTGGFNLPGLM
jgi:nucleoid-associated protein EbfC